MKIIETHDDGAPARISIGGIEFIRAPEGAIDSPYDDYDPEPDEDDDDGLDECGLHDDGQCDLAGTEWCDWSCPRGGLNLRQTGEA